MGGKTACGANITAVKEVLHQGRAPSGKGITPRGRFQGCGAEGVAVTADSCVCIPAMVPIYSMKG